MNERSNSEVSLGLGRVRPAWVPDESSARCQECEVKFTFIIRKHHCRACGRLLCGDCTRYQEPLEYLGWRLSRVCIICHNKLQKPPPRGRGPMRKTKSLNDFDELKENISRLIRSQQLAEAESCASSDTPDSGMDHVSRLPPELLARVLECLCLPDLLECRLVSRAWLAAVAATHFYSRCEVTLGAEAERKDEILRVFSSGCFKHFSMNSLPFDCKFPIAEEPSSLFIQTLKFCDSELSSTDLLSIIRNISRLRTLGLVNCKQLFISGTFLSSPGDRQSLTNKLEHLEDLILDNNSFLSDILLLRISASVPHLRSLSLSNCNIMSHSSGVVTRLYPECEDTPASPSVLTWRVVARIVRQLGRSLRSLNIARNTGITIEDLCDIKELCLESLDIMGCSSISAEGFLKLSECQKNISHLNIANARKILAGLKEQTESIFTSHKNVRALDLSDNSAAHLRALAAVTGLTSLRMDRLDSPGSVLASTLASLSTARLETWRARQLAMSSADLAHTIRQQNFAALRHLDLSLCAGGVVTDEVVSAVCSSMRSLEHLDLSGNEGVSDIGTLDLRADTSIQSIKEVLDGKILLGSRAEMEIVLASKKQKFAVELLTNSGDSEGSRGKLAHLRRLRHLDLSGTSISSLTLSHGLDCADLRTLAVSDCRGGLVSDQGLVEAARRHRRISELRLAASCVTDLGLVSTASSLPRLRHLDLRRCAGVSSSCLAPLAQLRPGLQTLLVRGCPAITPDMVKCVSPNFYSLKKIDL